MGRKGILFRKVHRLEQLERYLRHMPAAYLIQEFVQLLVAVSVFYCRILAQQWCKHCFYSKELLEVKGNGRSTLSLLVRSNPEARAFLPEVSRQLGRQME